MTNVRKPLTGLLALGAALAMPLAFAQDPTPTEAPPAGGATQQAEPLTWADLDTNGDGNLSREEAAAYPPLAAVFDQADADGDGQLTPQEYQAFAAAQGAGDPAGGSAEGEY
ncbi:hypothetical protein [Luteimonas abyssi]|uniref:hypothetical protein n=1 Tax=Luteimonas abyssi TaxID=1247514 RepID=UPI000737D5BC|nr:hypothetical protein [Luteimonas abyssi]